MNSLAARRAVLRMGAGFAVLPLFASRIARAAGVETNAVFAPPSCDMIYRRTLERPLPGGAQLLTTRDFRVRFVATQGGGFVIDGTQMSARVQAPDNLAALARLEEQRVEQGIFPLALDPRGQIVDGEEVPVDHNVMLALDEVQRRFAEHGGEVSELLDALAASSSRMTAQLPRDLFSPARSAVEQSENITLPWGQIGEVRVRFTASRTIGTNLMRMAMREVITSLEGEERRSSEQWELFAA